MRSSWLSLRLLAACAAAGLAIAAPAFAQEKEVSTGESQFETPVRLEADGQPIKVESPGWACPTVADVDGDGKLDLVVGQFNQGHMQFFKNLAEPGATPKFAAAQWLKNGEERAIVPGVW
ncbi:MAG: FG-GAP repeat domain-containing protein [Planctomycetota bacterium]